MQPRLPLVMGAGLLLLAGCPDESSDGDGGADGSTSEATSMGPTSGVMTGNGPNATTDVDTTASTNPTDPTDPTGMVDTTSGPNDGVHAYRFSSMFVRDPHFYVLGLGVLCVDVTDSTPTGDASINEQFNAAIGGDDPMDPDGNLDLNLMLLFRPLDQSDGGSGPMDFANGVCPVPPTTECDIRPGTDLDSSSYVVMNAGTCLEPDPTHLSSENYNPAPGSTDGPCFVSDPASVTISTTDFDLPLTDAVIAAQFGDGDPANQLVSGTLRGFLSMADATSIVLPPDIQRSTGAMTISELLPGGAGNCAGHDDTDGDGWYMYVDFEATRVLDWLGP